MQGQLYVLSGPSGAGKSTIIGLARKRLPGLAYSVSHTSRRPRENEFNGVHYHFVERNTFRKMIDADAFVEWAEVYGDFYGTSYSSLRDQMSSGMDVMLDLDSQGAKNIKEHFEESILVYILPPSLEVLEKRLRERATDDETVIDRRIGKAFEDLQACTGYDYLIINDDLNRAVGELGGIIQSERCRIARMLPKIKEIFGFL